MKNNNNDDNDNNHDNNSNDNNSNIYIYNDDDGNSNSNNVQLDAGFMTKTQPTIAAPGCQAVGKTVSRLSGDGGDGGDGDIQHTSRHGIRSL